jgi:uncharacterized cupredoxin-like copper-binding protein
MKRSSIWLVILAAVCLLSACGRQGDGNTRDSGTIGRAGGVEASTPVLVELSEMKVSLGRGQAPPGLVTFAATNRGLLPHELVVVRSDAPERELPVSGGVVDESKVQKVAESEEFAPGNSRTIQATLEPARYILLCNVVGHYEAGMHTTFTVR